MSRWKWTQPLGTPVVPLVKAISAGSSRRGVDGRQRLEAGGARLQLALAVVAVIFDECLTKCVWLDRLAEVADEAAVDDRVADLGAVDHRRDLAGAEQRHGRDDHAAGLEHAEPGGEQGVAVGPAQQHAVAGDQPFFLDQQPGDAAGEIVEVGIGPAAVGVDDGEVVRLAALEQLRGGVEPLGIMKLRQVEAELRQLAPAAGRRSRRSGRAHSGTTAVASISTMRVRLDQAARPRPAPSPDNAAHDRLPRRADLVAAGEIVVDRSVT